MGRRIVIIGAGLAGTTAARELAERGRAVTLIDPAAGDTYERPPLSKHLFDAARHHLPLRLDESDLVTLVRARAVSITTSSAEAAPASPSDPASQPAAEVAPGSQPGAGRRGSVLLDTGASLDFDDCILATGMGANAPEVPGYPDALPVYDLADAEWIRRLVEEASAPLDVGVLGSGYLGTEVASSAVAAGHRATMYLRGGWLLKRQLSAPVRETLHRLHREAGVDFVTGISGVEAIPAGRHDLLVTSVGARPRLIPIDGEIPDLAWSVNEKLATSHPGIWAVGDCAHVVAGPFALDRPWACEPVAEAHGKHMAVQLASDVETTWTEVPWHWSFQGPQKVFTAGLTSPDAVNTLLREGPAGTKMQVFHFASDDPDALLTGVETLNWPPMHAAARRVLGGAHVPTRAQTEADDFDLKAHSRL